MKKLYVKNSGEWREWLKNNYDGESEVWLVFYKGGKQPTIDYESAVEEALCYGWIDSIIKKIDDEKYVRKFTPRKDVSKWSESNKKRIARLIKSNRITTIGLAKVNRAKKNGCWYKSDIPDISSEILQEFQSALNKNGKAKETFKKLAPSYQKQFAGWISSAKQEATREKRIRESIELLEKGCKLGMK